MGNAFDDVQVVTIVPKDPGTGGTKSSYTSFTMPWRDVRLSTNVNVTRRRWQRDFQAVDSAWPNSGLNPNDLNATNSFSIHSYASYPSATVANPATSPTIEFLSHNAASGTESIFSHLSGSVLTTANFSGNLTAGQTVPAEFINIKDRCFVTSGGQNQGMIYKRDGATTTTWVVGIDDPQAAPVVSIKDSTLTNRPRAFGYAYQGQVNINSPDPAGLLNVPNATSVDIDYKQSTGGLVTRTTNTPGTAANISTGIALSITQGSRVITWAALPVVAPGNYIGMQIVLNGYKMIICEQGNISPNTSLGATQMLLAEPYNGPTITNGTSWSIIGSWVQFTVSTPTSQLVGATSWTNGSKYMCPVWIRAAAGGPFADWGTSGPQYAYAAYDADTGHISNVSPITQSGDPAAANCSVAIPADPGNLSYPPSADLTRFGYTVFFRTMTTGGSSLLPIGSLVPKLADGTWNPRWRGLPGPAQQSYPLAATELWEDAYLDSELLLAGAFVAPQFTNNRPRKVDKGVSTTLFPKHWTFWDGRVWMVASQDRRTLRFSCDAIQCPFGLPEESWPDTNILIVPAADGEILGFKLIGNLIVVLTQRFAYYIAGNNETNYRLMRLTTDMYGVGTYQCDEIPGPTKDTGAAIAFLGRDRRFYVMQPGQQPQWISEPIQSLLDSDIGSALENYQLCRVHYATAWGRKRLIVKTQFNCYRYDVESQTWDTGLTNYSTSATALPQAFCTSYGQSVPINEVFIYNGKHRSWLRDDSFGYYVAGQSGSLEFWPTTFDGRKTLKELVFVRIYVSDATLTWNCSIKVNEEGPGFYAGTFKTEEDSALSLYATPSASVDLTNAGELVVLAGDMTNDPNPQNSGPPLEGFRFAPKVTFPQSTSAAELYAVQIGYKVISPAEAS